MSQRGERVREGVMRSGGVSLFSLALSPRKSTAHAQWVMGGA